MDAKLAKPIASWLAKLPLWPFNVGAVASGPFVLLDFSTVATGHPRWAGPIEMLPVVIGSIFAISVVGLIAVQCGRSHTKESYRKLKRRAERAQELEDIIAENIVEIVNGILAGFGKQLRLESNDNSRISLYVANGSETLVSIGRYSTNPNYGGVGRKVLPKDQGCVGHAWALGWVFEGEFGTESYADHSSHFGMPPDLVEGLSMKPQYMAALRIDDGSESLAVLVFESMQPKRFDETQIKRKMISFSNYLPGTLKALAPHLPKPLAGAGEEL